MTKDCRIHSHYAGLFSLIGAVLTCRTMYRNVEVDWSSGCLYSTHGENLYETLFAPSPKAEGDFDVVIGYPDGKHDLTFDHVAKLYQAGNRSWRYDLNRIWDAMEPNEFLKLKAQSFTQQWEGHSVCSCLIRADTHAGEQVSRRSQTLDEYARAYEEWCADKHNPLLHVMAQDLASIEWMATRFPVTFFPDTRRVLTRAQDRHLTEPQTIADAQICFVEVLILAAAQALIHPCSNMATAALIINPAMDSIYLP